MEYVTRADDRCVELRGATGAPCADASVAGVVGRRHDGRLLLRTGVVAGPVRITVDVRAGSPTEVEHGWEDVVEVSCLAVERPVLVAGPYDDAPDPSLRIDPPDAESFRLRVHACHRDAGYDVVADEPVEEYLLTTWPAPPGPAVVLSAGSDLALRAVRARDEAGVPTGAAPSDAARVDVLRAVQRLRGDRPPAVVESVEDVARREAAQANLLRVTRTDGQP